ncbi:spore coat protein F [Pullulanibacillus camelliae]|uniref:Spore coat protein F n=1 Tax=Pullulanibacillus camelliae TaxID=1707096 RepID=A0A8J2YI03_9BACL|nr:spore coat protein [Pullulanibacillus camelliae]GGE44389.1 spore coat protein F [Pullulanibacillus camelliae]
MVLNDERPAHLAWHETLELHEIVAMQTSTLMKLEMFYPEIEDSMLQQLYRQAIEDHKNNLVELLRFYPKAPRHEKKTMGMMVEDSFFAGELLSCAKNSIKAYAAAITETATPSLREAFVKQLNQAITMHAKIFNYMHQQGYYPAYDLNQLLANDMKNAQKALGMDT